MRKILIVDDQPEVRELVDITLQVTDYEILHAENGEEALEVARAERPQLIIMDVVMPGGMDGLETTRILKSDPETAACKIVLLTAKSQQVDIDEGMAAGATGYFAKPFSPSELIKKVEEILGA